MTTSEIKARIHEIIDSLDEPFLEVVHSMLDTYVEKKHELNQDQKDMLDQRLEQYIKNPNEGEEWNNVKAELLSWKYEL